MPNIEDNEFARMIRELRSRVLLTQDQFAAKVAVTFSTLNRWESGKSKSKPLPLAMRQIDELFSFSEDIGDQRWPVHLGPLHFQIDNKLSMFVSRLPAKGWNDLPEATLITLITGEVPEEA